MFQWEEIDNAVLVGHSYGGWPISGAAERLVGKIASIVYLDAFVPENGQKGTDLSSAQFRGALQEAIAKGEAGRPVPNAEVFRIIDSRHVAWVQAKMTPQPTNLATSAIALTGARDRIAKKTSSVPLGIHSPPSTRIWRRRRPTRRGGPLSSRPSEAGHDIMVDAPQRLAEVLMDVM